MYSVQFGASTVALVVTIVTQVLYMRSYYGKPSGPLLDTILNKLVVVLSYEFLPGCYYWTNESDIIQWRTWCASLRLTVILKLIDIVGFLLYH
jgi:hypothetical protein